MLLKKMKALFIQPFYGMMSLVRIVTGQAGKT
jgi:hypothetical protein